jgi:hypothetical protein
MGQVLCAFWLLDFTILGPFSLGGRFESHETFSSLIFKFFSGPGEPRILNQCIRGHDCISTYARTNRSFKEPGSRINYVRSSIPPLCFTASVCISLAHNIHTACNHGFIL